MSGEVLRANKTALRFTTHQSSRQLRQSVAPTADRQGTQISGPSAQLAPQAAKAVPQAIFLVQEQLCGTIKSDVTLSAPPSAGTCAAPTLLSAVNLGSFIYTSNHDLRSRHLSETIQ
jgi:hypothetical protein